MRPFAGLSVFTGLILSLCFASSCFGWSNKEHQQLARLAAERLIAREDTPPAMKEWLKRNVGRAMTMEEEKNYFLNARVGIIARGVDGLPYWATMPDMHALIDTPDKKVDPYGVAERQLHFIDCEFFQPDETKRSYTHSLVNKPKVEDFPHDLKDPRYAKSGMLPFRVEECYQKTVELLKAGKIEDKPGQFPRDEHAVMWAGYLAHYLGDNTQPQHATIDYKSSAYFAQKTRAPNVHSEVEYKMVDDDHNDYMDLREEFWPIFAKALDEMKEPILTEDVFKSTVEVSLASYDALPLIGMAAMAASKQGGTPEKPEGAYQAFDTTVFFRFKGSFHGKEVSVLQMKAEQQAWAVHRIERLWLAAWKEANPAR